jgi:hypothetical protein
VNNILDIKDRVSAGISVAFMVISIQQRSRSTSAHDEHGLVLTLGVAALDDDGRSQGDARDFLGYVRGRAFFDTA